MLRNGHVLFGVRANARYFHTVLWVWGAGNSGAGTGKAFGGKVLSSVISQESTHEQVFGVICV